MIQLPRVRRGTKAYAATVAAARALVHARLAHYGALYGIKYGRVAIRNQKSRWGSCSRAGNLNFNLRIAFLPRVLADLIVVHELCHVVEHNHSKRFWALVAKTFPDWKERRKDLMRYRR